MRIPDYIKEIARNLRKNMTPAEEIFWNRVRAGRLWGMKFQRQFPIYVFTEDSWLERFVIPDFVCFEKKLIIEIDGSIHNTEEIIELDTVKEKLLENMGFTNSREFGHKFSSEAT